MDFIKWIIKWIVLAYFIDRSSLFLTRHIQHRLSDFFGQIVPKFFLFIDIITFYCELDFSTYIQQGYSLRTSYKRTYLRVHRQLGTLSIQDSELYFSALLATRNLLSITLHIFTKHPYSSKSSVKYIQASTKRRPIGLLLYIRIFNTTRFRHITVLYLLLYNTYYTFIAIVT